MASTIEWPKPTQRAGALTFGRLETLGAISQDQGVTDTLVGVRLDRSGFVDDPGVIHQQH